jgi:DNA gyrase/topoisomerase IV subunit A
MIVLVSQNGYVKRTHLSITMKHRGSEGMTLNTKWFRILREPEGKNDLVLLTNLGGIIRFPLNEIRPVGELATGVEAIRLQDCESIQDAIIMGAGEQ